MPLCCNTIKYSFIFHTNTVAVLRAEISLDGTIEVQSGVKVQKE